VPVDSGFLGLFGALFLVLSVLALIGRVLFVAGARECDAVLVEVRSGRHPREIVRLEDANGVVHQARIVRAGRKTRPVGTRVRVLHHPRRAGRVIECGRWDIWAPPVVGFVAGLVMIAVGVWG
jgi:hypothetical protein